MARAAHLPRRPAAKGRASRPGADQAGINRPPEEAKGRGARSNNSGRYEREQREAIDDGWAVSAVEFDGGASDADRAGRAGGPGCISDVGDPGYSGAAPERDSEARNLAPALKTEITIERPKKIITFNTSPFVGFDRSINPYRGCEHGCIYCFARPTHAYMGLSPGLDFEARLFAKPNAAALLRKELANPRYAPRVVAMGTNTDPYQPVEKKFRIMRGVLETFLAFRHPVTVLTKGSLITRDIDLLAALAEHRLTRAMISITTRDKTLARSMEPRAAAPGRRFDAVRQLSAAGVPVGVMTAPMIPGLNDDELESLLDEAKDAGAAFAGYTIVRLPLEVSPLFQEWLETYAPARAARVMRHIRDLNGGKDYDVDWSRGGEIKAPYAQLIAQRFAKAAARLGLDGAKPGLDLTQFRVPAASSGQLSLFGDEEEQP